MTENRKFGRILPIDINGCLICWQKTAFIELENISLGGVKVKHVPHGVIGQVGQIYFSLDRFGEIFTDFRCLQKSNGVIRLMFKNLSYAEQKVLSDFMDCYEFPLEYVGRSPLNTASL